MNKRRGSIERLGPALKAIGDLFEDGLVQINSLSSTEALVAHSEIEQRPVAQKTGPFFRHFVPLCKAMIALLADSYRRYFKVALAHGSQTGDDPDKWAQRQLGPAVRLAMEWIPDWYILACDGENRWVRHVGSMPFVPGQTVSSSIPTAVAPFPPLTSWRAPAWLFQVSPLVGVGPLKDKHFPTKDSEQRLGEAHTRLLLNGARRVFLWDLGAAIDTVRKEETAAAGAIPAEPPIQQTQVPKGNRSNQRSRGTEGLVHKKTDLSQYMDNLTEKQRLAFSLRFEYGLRLAEVASRMGIDRKTAFEHVEAARRKIDQVRSNLQRDASRAKRNYE